jgi:hypothetical protein
MAPLPGPARSSNATAALNDLNALDTRRHPMVLGAPGSLRRG